MISDIQFETLHSQQEPSGNVRGIRIQPRRPKGADDGAVAGTAAVFSPFSGPANKMRSSNFLFSACVLLAATATITTKTNAFTMKHSTTRRPRHIHVYFLPSELPEEQPKKGQEEEDRQSTTATYVVIDVIRATTTMVHALSNGVGTLIPCGTIQEAYQVKEYYSKTHSDCEVLLGGERQGVRIDGFDLSNSPNDYTRERVKGRVVCFTTTNGTKALMKCKSSSSDSSIAAKSKIYIGAFCNLSAVARKILDDGNDDGSDGAGPIHIVCAGSNGQVCGEDVLFAGALCEQLMLRQENNDDGNMGGSREEESQTLTPLFFFEDSARIAMYQWKEETGGVGYPVIDNEVVQNLGSQDEDRRNVVRGVKQTVEGRLQTALRQTKGGRGLVALGPSYEGDIDIVAQIDTHDLVGVYQQQSQEKISDNDDGGSGSIVDDDQNDGDNYNYDLPSIIVAI